MAGGVIRLPKFFASALLLHIMNNIQILYKLGSVRLDIFAKCSARARSFTIVNARFLPV